MKRIVITENQLEMVKKNIAEGAVDGNRYGREVKVSVNSYGTKINGEEIDWVDVQNIKLTYIIEQEHRSWGIKDISLYSIQGPSEIELIITPQTDDADEINITIPISWDDVVETETNQGEGVITIGNEIEINIFNDDSGEIGIKNIMVPIYTL